MNKKLLALALAGAMSLSLLAACGGDEPAPVESTAPDDGAAAAGSVYYLNFKPEQNDAWQALAAKYTETTGVPVTVVTAASGEYETQLMTEINKSTPPTLFQVNGPVGLANWKDYCYDLSGSKIYGQLTNDAFALKDGEAVDGIAYVVESYGLICNKTLLAKAGYAPDDIASFEDLKKVAEDITARKDELGFAAFSSSGMDPSSDWRFQTHLANLPIYFEYQDEGIGSSPAIQGTYLAPYRNIWNLYINNSTCDPAELSAKTGDDSRNEFLAGQAVFFQNGSWEYNALIDGGLTDDDLVMLPIYIGAGDEANQGLCTGTENFWCVNSKAAPEDIDATLDFINWCVTSEEGTTAMANEMGFVIPFKAAVESPNLFVKNDVELVAAGKTPVSWNFATIPSEEWKHNLSTALTMYAADQSDANWDMVKSAFVDNWAAEYELTH